MMKRVLMGIAVALTLSACDRYVPGKRSAERSDAVYRSAMADYSAGRLDAARKGFEKAIGAYPMNASAHFQLACLLQDRIGEPLAAYVEYMMFLKIDPTSDKAAIAAERAKLCLKFYQAALMKGDDVRGETVARELEKIRREYEARGKKIAAMEKEREDMQVTVENISRENDRLRALIDGYATDTEAEQVDLAREAELFGHDDEEPERDIVKEADDIERISRAEDAVNGESSSLLPKQTADAKEKREERRQAERETKNAARKSAIAHPETYKVVEGDTLYRLAQRFYGRRSAWKMIMDANRDKVSNDGKLRIGDVIKLP